MSNGQEKELEELPEVNLNKLIETCTEGLDVVDGDDNVFNMLTVMAGFKKEALKLLKRKSIHIDINIDTNRDFLKLIYDTYRNVNQCVSRVDIAEDDERVKITRGRIAVMENVLLQQGRQLMRQRNAMRDAAPATEPKAPTEETSTQKRPFSWRNPWTWRRGEEQPSHERIRQLLSRMQELNA